MYVGVKELEVESITYSPDKGAGEGAKQPGDKEILPAVDSLPKSLGQERSQELRMLSSVTTNCQRSQSNS